MQNFMQFYTEVNFIDDDALSLCLSLSLHHAHQHIWAQNAKYLPEIREFFPAL